MSQLPLFKYDEIFSAPVRLLVKESHAIFTTIPRNATEMTRSNVIAVSRRYRSIVHECVENLTRDIANDNSDQIKTFRQLEIIWNLCEILLLDINQTGTLIIQLKNWIKMHFEELDADSREILKSLENNNYKFSENDVAETYWNLAVKLVLRGELKKTIQLLKSHSDYETNNQIQLVASMLERMPFSNQYIVHEFCNKWVNWSSWCKRELDTGQFESNPALLSIVKLLSQDLEVYEQLAPNCETWYQLMVSYLLFTDPCIKETDLSELCRRSISIFKRNHPKYQHGQTTPDDFDEIIIYAFEYDLLQVLSHCCAYLNDNWWFVTHFVDLLHCSNQLKIHEIADSNRLREAFLQDYAGTLFDDDTLWPLGVSYLDSCPTNGSFLLEALLSRVPLNINDEIRAHKIIAIAKKRGLTALSRSICALMARSWLSKTPKLDQGSIKVDKFKRTIEVDLPPPVNLANALYWAIRSNDTSLTTYISDQYLYYFCKTGSFPDKSIFESLRRSPLDNERLAFLAKYFEFKQIVQDSEDDLSEAGNLIKALLASKIYPRFFCHELLEDAKNLLEVRPQLVFQPDSTLDLMRSIESITEQNAIDGGTELRKNIVRNMARALITPIHDEK